MQVSEADNKNTQRVGVEEEFTKFHKFDKIMKKFLMNRSDCTDTAICQKEAAISEVLQPQKGPKKDIKPVLVQPPLPPYPPPPDSPPNLKIVIKQEKLDDEVVEAKSPPNGTEQSIHRPQVTRPTEKPVQHKEPKKTICKEFIRGNCKRPVCKFAHEVDLSQLRGVFTFCWDYQNAVCTYPNCRYVHATIFEEGEFYRTGELPPHVRKQMKLGPPPSEETQQDNNMHQSNFNNNPPPFHLNGDKSMPVITCVPTNTMEARPEDTFRGTIPRSISPLKREWRELDEFSSSPRDLEPHNDHVAKKCKSCDIMEFSVNYNKEMVENIIQTSEETKKKINLLNKKTLKLCNVLYSILRPMLNNKTTLASGVMGNDKGKSVMEHLNDLFAEDNLKNQTASNLSNLNNLNNLTWIGKFLCSGGDQGLPSDSALES